MNKDTEVSIHDGPYLLAYGDGAAQLISITTSEIIKGSLYTAVARVQVSILQASLTSPPYIFGKLQNKKWFLCNRRGE